MESSPEKKFEKPLKYNCIHQNSFKNGIRLKNGSRRDHFSAKTFLKVNKLLHKSPWTAKLY